MTLDDQNRGAARELFCRLLAACYYEPSSEFAEENVFESMVGAARRIDSDLAAHTDRLGKAFFAEGADELLLDYACLFLGPPQAIAPPYGSVWMGCERTLMQDSTMAVLELYREGGFELDDEFRELPDHVAAELEFLYLLIYRENQARLTGERVELTAIGELRRRFLDEHLGAWIGPFTAAVASGAKSAFYRELAGLTDRFVRMAASAAER